MKIAVTYDNGQVFQHFGRTENFKVYDVEDGKVVGSEIISSGGTGHGALAGLLANQDIQVLICGGIGSGAQTALAEAEIELCAGAQGDVDAAVDAYLKGELENAGVTCDHHEHEEGHACGEHGCGSNCGGGCGGFQMQDIGPNAGKTVKTHYLGTLDDGSVFDSSYDRGEPLEFICGIGMMIRGYDVAVANMVAGEVRDVHLEPEEAYGPVDPNAVFTVSLDQMPGAEEVEVGETVYLQTGMGQPMPVKVIAKDSMTITFDANHELAGKALNFRIELVEVK